MTMKLREKYDFPVIMLSAKSEEVDKAVSYTHLDVYKRQYYVGSGAYVQCSYK